MHIAVAKDLSGLQLASNVLIFCDLLGLEPYQLQTKDQPLWPHTAS